MIRSKFAVILTILVLSPVIALVGCNDSDNDDPVVVTNTVPAVTTGTLQVIVTGSLVIDAFTQVNIKVDGTSIGAVAWPAGGTLNYPTTPGVHAVTADTDGPSTRHWNSVNVTIPNNGVAATTLDAANSVM